MSEVYINLGLGKTPRPSFVSIERKPGSDIQYDASEGLAFPDASADGLYCVHFLELLSQSGGLSFLRECRRVLKTTGILRIVVPDLDDIVQRYLSAKGHGDGGMLKPEWPWIQDRCEMLNIEMREHGQQWLYNEDALRLAAQRAGLTSLGRFQGGDSSIDGLSGLETHDASSLIMEFRPRPAIASKQPLVSLVIPAYNPRFFDQSLRSALAQSYPNLEILICDDCRDGGIRVVVEQNEDPRIRYEFNKEQQGPLGNYLKCMGEASGELIKFLNDDDILEPSCVERMVQIFASRPDVTLVTSHRQVIDEEDNSLPDFFSTSRLLQEDSLIDGLSLATTVLSLRHNLIGEPSTVMFRADDVQEIRPHLFSFGGETLVGAGDMGLWLNLLSKGHAAYLPETLSKLRIHKQQRSQAPGILEAGRQSWLRMRFHAARFGMYDENVKPYLRVSPLDGTDWETRPAPVDPELAALEDALARAKAGEPISKRLRRQLDRHLLWRLKR